MLRIDKVIKPWKESAALNDHINLYGFWNERTFLTKSGDVGMVLSISGVDYESFDRSEPWRMRTGLRKLVLENDIKQRTMDLQSAPAIVNEA
jgi:type IV secretory pathway VirB4 component